MTLALGLYDAELLCRLRREQFAALLQAWPAEDLAWEPLPVTVDEYGLFTLGRWGGYLLQISHMLLNDRLVMTPQRNPMVYEHGWCYPRGVGALLAALCWDPQEQAEPPGYLKRATPRPRAAGERAP